MTNTPELSSALALLASWGLSTLPEDRPRGERSASEITLVRQALSAGATWEQIGAATGYTRQAAHRRWRRYTRGF